MSCKECLERLRSIGIDPQSMRTPRGGTLCRTCPSYEEITIIDYTEDEPRQARPIVNVTYKVNDVNTPAFRDLQDQIKLINGRLTKYFGKRRVEDPF